MLRKDSRCHFCGSKLPAGSSVQWYQTSGRFVSRHHYKAPQNKPCCPGDFPGQCEAMAREEERKAEAAALSEKTAELMALIMSADTVDDALIAEALSVLQK